MFQLALGQVKVATCNATDDKGLYSLRRVIIRRPKSPYCVDIFSERVKLVR